METNNLYIFVLHVEIYADAVRGGESMDFTVQ